MAPLDRTVRGFATQQICRPGSANI